MWQANLWIGKKRCQHYNSLRVAMLLTAAAQEDNEPDLHKDITDVRSFYQRSNKCKQ